MAKKKPAVDLSHKEILFELNKERYKVVLFKPDPMTVDVIRFEQDGSKTRVTLPFAHLPKAIKLQIKP